MHGHRIRRSSRLYQLYHVPGLPQPILDERCGAVADGACVVRCHLVSRLTELRHHALFPPITVREQNLEVTARPELPTKTDGDYFGSKRPPLSLPPMPGTAISVHIPIRLGLGPGELMIHSLLSKSIGALHVVCARHGGMKEKDIVALQIGTDTEHKQYNMETGLAGNRPIGPAPRSR